MVGTSATHSEKKRLEVGGRPITTVVEIHETDRKVISTGAKSTFDESIHPLFSVKRASIPHVVEVECLPLERPLIFSENSTANWVSTTLLVSVVDIVSNYG
jgi:hypothetical protein